MIKARDFTAFVCESPRYSREYVSAVPPPPALEPPELSQVIEGYDLSAPFQLWFYWVESRKGEVVQSLLSQPDELPGERTIGPPIFTFTRTNDYGRYMSGEIRTILPQQRTARHRPQPLPLSVSGGVRPP